MGGNTLHKVLRPCMEGVGCGDQAPSREQGKSPGRGSALTLQLKRFPEHIIQNTNVKIALEQ